MNVFKSRRTADKSGLHDSYHGRASAVSRLDRCAIKQVYSFDSLMLVPMPAMPLPRAFQRIKP